MRTRRGQTGMIAGTRALLGITVLLGAMGGCASGTRLALRTEIAPFTPEQRALYAAAGNARYRLRIGDTFTIDFKYEDELDQHHLTVLPDGRFTMAGLEDVRAQGLTIPELDSLVTTHFAREYRNPELSVIIEELGKQRVHVLGEVRQPGTYELPMSASGGVLQAISLAGGFTVNAAASEAVIIRVTDQGWLYRHCDLSHLEKGPLRDLGYLDLQPSDIVYVPRSAIGDWASFADRVLPGLGNLSSFFWDAYAITHLEKLNMVTR